METPPLPRQSWIPALDRAGWAHVADRVIHGLTHDFTGRVSALAGLSYLLESPGADTSSILPLLNQEVEQMEESVRLLRLLPDDSTEPEILAPGEILPELVRLVATQRGLENVEVRIQKLETAPAVRIDRTLFIRALLLLFSAGAEEAVLRGSNLVVVRADGADERLNMDIQPLPGEERTEPDDAFLLPRRLLPRERLLAWREAMEAEGVEVRDSVGESGVGTLQLSFPPP